MPVRKIIIAILLIVALAGVGILMFQLGKRSSRNTVEPSPTPQIRGISTISFADVEYAYGVVKVEDASSIKLLPNFSKQKTSEEIMVEGGCRSLVSGGFYSEDFRPLGLFITEREVISEKESNATLNGFFLVSEADSPEITKEMRDEEVRIGLQTGPILIFDSTPLNLNLRTEEQDGDRRVTLALNENGEVFFLVIYKAQSVFEGPTLESLPQVTKKIGEALGENLVSAINLDGGAASTFWSEDATLKELSPLGSYFCIN